LTALPFTDLRSSPRRPGNSGAAKSRRVYIRQALEQVAEAALDQPNPSPELRAALERLADLRAAQDGAR